MSRPTGKEGNAEGCKDMSKFNIRVYGLLTLKGDILLLEEWYAGRKLVKFPGGGLEYGEGTKDCLKRECMEELNIQITDIQHFYTTDFFQASAFREGEQLLSIYYRCHARDEHAPSIKERSIERIKPIPLSELKVSDLSLPVDQHVAKALIADTRKRQSGF